MSFPDSPSISPIPRAPGAQLVVANSADLAVLDVSGFTLSTRVYNIAENAVFVLSPSTADVGDFVVAVAGVTGLRWLLETGAPVAWLLVYSSPDITRSQGFASAVDGGSGAWTLTLSSGLTVGTYYAAFQNMSGTALVTASVAEGSDTVKLLQIQVDGSGGTPNGFYVAIYRLPPL